MPRYPNDFAELLGPRFFDPRGRPPPPERIDRWGRPLGRRRAEPAPPRDREPVEPPRDRAAEPPRERGHRIPVERMPLRRAPPEQPAELAPEPAAEAPAPASVLEPEIDEAEGVEAEQPAEIVPAEPEATAGVTRLRERVEREAQREIARERERMLRDFVELVDDLERALAAGDGGELAEGVAMVRQRFLDKLGRYGVTRCEDTPGDRFDPERHEAIGTVAAGDEHEGRLVEVLRPAYLVDDELLRPAQVIVGRA